MSRLKKLIDIATKIIKEDPEARYECMGGCTRFESLKPFSQEVMDSIAEDVKYYPPHKLHPETPWVDTYILDLWR